MIFASVNGTGGTCAGISYQFPLRTNVLEDVEKLTYCRIKPQN